MERKTGPDSHIRIPLKPAEFYLMLTLKGSEQNATMLQRKIDKLTRGQFVIPVPTLYVNIRRLLDQSVVKIVDNGSIGRGNRIYGLTEKGSENLDGHIKQMKIDLDFYKRAH